MKNLRFTGSLVRTFAFLSFSFSFISPAEAQQWPEAGREAKPYTRWWWHGSAVDSAGIDYCMTQYAKAGLRVFYPTIQSDMTMCGKKVIVERPLISITVFANSSSTAINTIKNLYCIITNSYAKDGNSY